MNTKVRIDFLDGLRGLAAFIVFIGHYNMYFNNLRNITLTTNQLPAFIQFPMEAFVLFIGNGNLSVSIFFVLSGFVLSYTYFVSPSPHLLINHSLKRYFRLTIPILSSVLIISLLFYFHIFYSKETLLSLGVSGKFPFYHDMIDANLLTALEEGLWGCIFNGTTYYNEVLWTMSVEFFGSLLVFSVLGIFGKSPVRFLVYFLLHLYLLNSYYCLFITGVVLADLSARYSSINRPFFGLVLVLIGVFISVFYYNRFLYTLLPFGDLSELKRFAFNRIASVFIVLGILVSHPLKNIFTGKFLLMLGKISFVLYLFHIPFISIVSVFFLKTLSSYFSLNASAHYAFFITMILLLPLCYYLLIHIDKTTIVLSNKISSSIQKWVSKSI